MVDYRRISKISFRSFPLQRESNYSHSQISGVPNLRDHRLETTPPDDTIYSVSQSRWRPVARYSPPLETEKDPFATFHLLSPRKFSPL